MQRRGFLGSLAALPIALKSSVSNVAGLERVPAEAVIRLRGLGGLAPAVNLGFSPQVFTKSQDNSIINQWCMNIIVDPAGIYQKD